MKLKGEFSAHNQERIFHDVIKGIFFWQQYILYNKCFYVTCCSVIFSLVFSLMFLIAGSKKVWTNSFISVLTLQLKKHWIFSLRMSRESTPLACIAFWRFFKALKTFDADSDFLKDKFSYLSAIFLLHFWKNSGIFTDFMLLLPLMFGSSLFKLSELDDDEFLFWITIMDQSYSLIKIKISFSLISKRARKI